MTAPVRAARSASAAVPLAPAARPRRIRLGWLGPLIVGVGAAVATVGIWYFQHARPVPGAVIDTVAVDGERTLVVRGEASGGERGFVELRDGDRTVWQALVPRYGGRPGAPGVAWSATAVTVRVVRNGRAELFAIAFRDGSKLAGIRLAPEHGPVIDASTGPVTLTDHARSYELVAGAGWHQLVGIDLTTGRALWSRELGAAPVTAGGLTGSMTAGAVWLVQGGERRCYAAPSGHDVADCKP